MEPWVSTALTIVGSVTASSGFWAWMLRRSDKKSASTKLIRGLARREIISEGLRYISRGWISKDEFEEFGSYLYEPYFELGGNGLAEKIVSEVKTLPIRKKPPSTGEIQQVNY